MAENQLTGGSGTVDTSMYPRFQPMPQPTNPLAQVNELVNLQRSFQAAQQQQLELGRGRLNYLHQQLGALAAKVDPKTMQPNASMDDVKNVIGSLADAGVPQWQVQKELQKFKGKDAAGIQDLARQHMAQIADHAATMGMAFGVPEMVHQGDIQQPVARNPYSQGVAPIGQPFAQGATPEAKLAPQTVTDAAGNVIQTTAAGAAAAKGFSPRSGMPLQGAFTTPGGAPKGIAGPSATFGPSLDAYNTDLRTSSDLAKTIRTSSQALQLADTLGTTGTGPGTKPFNDAKAFLESVGIRAPDNAVAMRNELDKYLQQTINSSPLAQRSDLGAISTKLGTPNTTEQTNAATRALLRTGIAQAGMDAAVPHAYNWQSNNGSVAGYLQHKGTFTQNQDQQAYAIAQGLVDPVEAAKTIQKMRNLPASNVQKQKFFSSLENSKKAGLWNLPGTTNAPGQ